jgi:hypothetical protein
VADEEAGKVQFALQILKQIKEPRLYRYIER